VARPINLASGDVVGGPGAAKSFVEYFRRDRSGAPYDTQFELVSREEAYTTREIADEAGQEFPPPDSGGRFFLPFGDPWRSPPPAYNPPPQRRDAYGQPPQQQQPFFGQTYGQSGGQPSYGQPQRGSDPRAYPQPRGNPGFFWNWR
jgi:hypothetical protein